MLICGAAFAERDVNSANAVMPGCRDFISPSSEKKPWEQMYCAGLIAGLHYASCSPGSATTNQVARVVIQYIDARPARMHEDFRGLALEAMKAAWPCKADR